MLRVTFRRRLIKVVDSRQDASVDLVHGLVALEGRAVHDVVLLVPCGVQETLHLGQQVVAAVSLDPVPDNDGRCAG